jgi:hypothetical protein
MTILGIISEAAKGIGVVLMARKKFPPPFPSASWEILSQFEKRMR